MEAAGKTSSYKSRYNIKPQDMTKTVGEVIDEALTKKAQGVGAAAPAFHHNTPILPNDSNVSWPMPVERFQYGHFLEPGDIILSTRLESFFSFLSRTFDDSRFAHAALTFVTPRTYPAVDRSYVIEASFNGIDLNAFSDFATPSKVLQSAKRKPRYIAGIKRLETDWFTDEMRPLVGGRMLRFIKDDNYNFSLLAALALDRSKLMFRLRNLFFGRAPTITDYLKSARKFAPSEFICSGFVQFAYVDMIREAVLAGLLDAEQAEKARNDVFFAPWVSEDSSMEELMAVKPRELAGTSRLKWKYLIYGGEVHKVSTDAEVNEIYDRVNADKRPWYKP